MQILANYARYFRTRSPLSTSLGKGVHREVGSEGSRWPNKAMTYRNWI